MKNKTKNKRLKGTAAACAVLLLAGCAPAESAVTVQELLPAADTTDAASAAETTQQGDASATAATAATTITAEYTDRDLAGSWDAAQAVSIVCDGTTAAITGSGAVLQDGVLTITAAGTYVLAGTFTGKLVVAAGEDDKVQLVLNGIAITAADGPALEAQTADKVFLTLAEGTENTLTDGSTYTLAAAQTEEDAPNACVYAQCDLTINGSGALRVTGNYHHGIYTKDDLRVTGGSITVVAAGDGLKGKDSVSVCDGVLTITAGGDGVQASNATDSAKGWVCLDGGTFVINAGGDGIQAETVLQLNDGDYTVTTGNGAANAASLAADTSAKGFKAGGGININGGTLYADCADDAVHTNGSATITAGALRLASGDDGVHADATLAVSGGSVAITQSYEGLEGEVVEISAGSITVVASDDGINCAGGTDGGTGGLFGTDSFAHGGGMGGADADALLHITGGTIVVDAGGDGLDSNGTMVVDGGIVLVAGPTDTGNGALDTGSSATVNGGCVIAVGSTGMAVNFDSGTQGAWLAATGQQAAGTTLTLTDETGNVLLSWTPSKAYSCAVLSCPELTVGESYNLVCGGTVEGQTDANGFAQSGSVAGGTTAATTTLAALQSSDVSGMGGGMGGNRGNFGGGTAPSGDGTMPQKPTDGTQRGGKFGAETTAGATPQTEPPADTGATA